MAIIEGKECFAAMTKAVPRAISAILAALIFLMCFSGCSPSPTALTVGGRKVDASEYAFFLHANRVLGDGDGETGLLGLLSAAREGAVDQIVTSEVIRIKCRELNLALSDENRDALKNDKASLKALMGGDAAYLEYLTDNALTDRCYDKFCETTYYYQMLYAYVTEELDKELYVDETLRKYFAENYILVKYIRISDLDEEGYPLDVNLSAQQRQTANMVHARLSQGAAFDEMMDGFNDDPVMTDSPQGLVLSLAEAQGRDYLLAAFGLKAGQVSDVLRWRDGYYIVKRVELSVGYFETNRAQILQSAKDFNFQARLDGWKAEAVVKVKKIVDEITLDNLMEYVK